MNSSSLRRIGQTLLIPILAVFSALVVGAIIMWIFGDNPIAAYRGLFEGAVGSARDWSTTIRKMTPLILTARDWLTGMTPAYLGFFLGVNLAILVLLFVTWIVFRAAMPILIERMSA